MPADIYVLASPAPLLYVYPSALHPDEPEPETPSGSHRAQNNRLREAAMQAQVLGAINVHNRRKEELALISLGVI